jgi:hypothetical protein
VQRSRILLRNYSVPAQQAVTLLLTKATAVTTCVCACRQVPHVVVGVGTVPQQ